MKENKKALKHKSSFLPDFSRIQRERELKELKDNYGHKEQKKPTDSMNSTQRELNPSDAAKLL